MFAPAKLAAAFVAAVVANAYGLQFGRYFFGTYDTGAGLKGTAMLGVGCFVATYLFIRHVRLDRLTSFLFAILMAVIFGRQVGYSLYFARFDLQADIYGMGTVFIFALIPGELIVWPILRTFGNGVVTATRKGMEDRPRLNLSRFGLPSFKHAPTLPPQTPAALWQSIRSGTDVTYRGRVDRDFSYFEGRTRKERIRMGFTLERDTLAMSLREQQAYYILRMLQQYAGLDAATSDPLQFGLAFGNGGTVTSCDTVRTNPRITQPMGFRTGEDFVRHEVAARGASAEAAISRLFGMLRRAAAAPGAAPELVKLQSRFTGNSDDSRPDLD